MNNNFPNLKYCEIMDASTETDFEFCDFQVKWNVEVIIKDAPINLIVHTGYIVQMVKLTVSLEEEPERIDRYYEAWYVKNKVIDSFDFGYDDHFSSGVSDSSFSNEYGRYSWETQVYWIPIGTPLYDTVSQWQPKQSGYAGQLSTEDYSDELNIAFSKYKVFDREEFTHKWDRRFDNGN